MECLTLAGAAILLCCTAASSRAASAPDAPVTCQAGRESALASGRITLRPGETSCVRLRSSGGRVEPEAIVAGPDAAGALVREASLRDGQTMLGVKNPLPATLKLRAWVRRPMQGEAQATSTCAILARLTNFEGGRTRPASSCCPTSSCARRRTGRLRSRPTRQERSTTTSLICITGCRSV